MPSNSGAEGLLKRILPEGLKRLTRRLRARGIAILARRMNLARDPLAHIFLRGHGVEIGSLNWPLDVPAGAKVTYVDAWPTETLKQHFPEHARTLLPVSIVARVETLAPIPDASQDFVIANHVLEHSENPIAAVRSMLRVLRVDGILFISLPDKRFTFDASRPLTSFEHLVRDDEEGPSVSRRDHYQEFLTQVEGVGDAELEDRVEAIVPEEVDMHYHVWTQAEMLQMLTRLRTDLGFPLDLEAMSKSGLEAIFVLRKTA